MGVDNSDVATYIPKELPKHQVAMSDNPSPPRHAGLWIVLVILALGVVPVVISTSRRSGPVTAIANSTTAGIATDTSMSTVAGISQTGVPDDPDTVTGNQAADEALKAGSEAFAGGDFAAALEQYTSVTQLAPRFANGFVALANTYAATGDHEKALANYQAAISVDPSDESAWFSRGLLLWMLGRLEEAEPDLRKAIELDPADEEAYRRLAVVLFEADKKTEIADLYEGAYEGDAGRNWALSGWLAELTAQKEYDAVFEICDSEESEHPAEVALYRGLANYEVGRYADAVTSLEEVIRLDPYELGFAAHEKLYLAYRDSGRPDDCQKEEAVYAALIGRVADPRPCQEASP